MQFVYYLDWNIHGITSIQQTFGLDGCPFASFATLKGKPINCCIIDHRTHIADCIAILKIKR